tara:strand:+ start:1709 stop:2395 length:687 start_codon:yes stop_codon:yes gene_type:complete
MKNIFKYLYYMYYRPKIFYPKKTYSMYGEDLVVQKYFKNKKKGYYVDIGCYHPIDGNNTYLLYKKGWSGVNIDINQLSIELFKKARKDDLNINIAISNKFKKVKLYYRKKINMLNTIDKKFAKINFKKGFNTKTIYSNSLDSILKKSKYKNKKIDFLNLDIEGNEINALKSINFKKYKPKLVCIEIHNLKSTKNNINYYKKSPIYKFLDKKGYKLLWSYGFSFIFKNS